MNKIMNLVADLREKELLLPIWMEGDALYIVDQLKLPNTEVNLKLTKVEELAAAIKDMTIRGSGAIGISGAYGMALAACICGNDRKELHRYGQMLKGTRPTAINLMKTVDEMLVAVDEAADSEITAAIEDKCVEILERQLNFEYQLGKNGAELIQDGDTILTHCHSGALAGSGYGGRALSVIRMAHQQGKKIHVISSETRPYLQGARITIYELEKFGIPHTMITDGMSGYLMKLGRIQKVVVGSDRVAANGDLLNKAGTYMHALAAKDNGVPFYTATSSHTIDFGLARGMDIGVEFRNAKEVTHLAGIPITLPNTEALYPSFDVTPNHLISGIITEKGVIRAPFTENLSLLE